MFLHGLSQKKGQLSNVSDPTMRHPKPPAKTVSSLNGLLVLDAACSWLLGINTQVGE